MSNSPSSEILIDVEGLPFTVGLIADNTVTLTVQELYSIVELALIEGASDTYASHAVALAVSYTLAKNSEERIAQEKQYASELQDRVSADLQDELPF